MNCERCGERPAEVRYTEIRDGESRQHRLCPDCADELGFSVSPSDPPPPEPVGVEGLVMGVLSTTEDTTEAATEHDAVRCPVCGITGAELRNQTLLGCPQCYVTFAGALEEVILRMQGSVRHVGRLPGGRIATGESVVELRARLEEAIRREDFDEAARIRNRLRGAR